MGDLVPKPSLRITVEWVYPSEQGDQVVPGHRQIIRTREEAVEMGLRDFIPSLPWSDPNADIMGDIATAYRSWGGGPRAQ